MFRFHTVLVFFSLFFRFVFFSTPILFFSFVFSQIITVVTFSSISLVTTKKFLLFFSQSNYLIYTFIFFLFLF
jgi:hypothetical protein